VAAAGAVAGVGRRQQRRGAAGVAVDSGGRGFGIGRGRPATSASAW